MGSGLLDIMRRSNNALRAFETSLRIHTNNSANLGTVGYKNLDYSFKTIFNDVLRDATSSNGNTGTTNPEQVGSGVAISNINLDFRQGDLGEGTQLDMAISGQGLFMVSRDGGNNFLYTRAGEASVDTTGQFLVDSSGRQIFGYKIVGGVASGELTPIKTDGFTSDFLGWRAGGILVGNFDDGNAATPAPAGAETPLYQVALADFQNSGGLQQEDGTAFVETTASGSPIHIGVAGTSNLGDVVAQKIEKSNVFFIGETIKSIEVQRAISASLSAIKTASDIISSVIQRLG
jgi:flagellar hook protein FlgE